MTSAPGAAGHDGDRAASLTALAAEAVIGNRLRLPEARCEGGACGARFEDPAALGEGDLRTRAIAAGWREDLAGLLTCPACQQRSPWPDVFHRGRRAAHGQPAGQYPAPGQPAASGQPAAHGQPADHRTAAPVPPPGYQPAAPAPAPAGQPRNRQRGGRRRADPRQAATPLSAMPPVPPPLQAPPPLLARPPAGADAAWQPPARRPGSPPDGEVPPRDPAFTEWGAWTAG